MYKFRNEIVPLTPKIGDDEFTIGLFLKSQPRIKHATFFAVISGRKYIHFVFTANKLTLPILL